MNKNIFRYSDWKDQRVKSYIMFKKNYKIETMFICLTKPFVSLTH